MSDCLHCDINEMVQKHIESAENPDIADLVARIAESLADTILNFVPEEDQATVLAHSVAQYFPASTCECDMFLANSTRVPTALPKWRGPESRVKRAVHSRRNAPNPRSDRSPAAT